MHEGKALKSLISKAGIDFQDFADKLEISRQTLSIYFSRSELKDDVKQKSAKLLGVSLDVFKGNDTLTTDDVIPVSKTEYKALQDLIEAQRELIEQLKKSRKQE